MRHIPLSPVRAVFGGAPPALGGAWGVGGAQARALHDDLMGAVREAIEAWVNRHEPLSSPYEVVKDLLGVVRRGNSKGSEQTGLRFTKLLKGRKGRS